MNQNVVLLIQSMCLRLKCTCTSSTLYVSHITAYMNYTIHTIQYYTVRTFICANVQHVNVMNCYTYEQKTEHGECIGRVYTSHPDVTGWP